MGMILLQEETDVAEKAKETAQETAEDISVSLKPVIEKVDRWVNEGIELLPNFIVALVLLLIFFLIGKFVKRLMNRYLVHNVENKAAINIIANIVYFIVIILGLILALSVLNLSDAVTGFLAGAGIVGVALGFAFQDTAANFISGTFMAFRKNFRVGDLIETNDTTAVVDHIDLRVTTLKTLDGYQVILPNKDIFQSKLTNYNRYSTRRINLTCGVGYESDLEKVKKVVLQAVQEIEEIKETPSPQFFYTEFGDSSINFVCRFWIDFLGMPDYLDAKHLAIMRIKKRFDAEGINIPFPIRTLDFAKNQLNIHGMEQFAGDGENNAEKQNGTSEKQPEEQNDAQETVDD